MIMGYKTVIIVILVGVTISYIVPKIRSTFQVPPIPKLEDTWWGPVLKPGAKEDQSIKPFKINISDAVLNDLEHRLSIAKPLQRSLENVAQNYGMNDKLLREILEFWRENYNWREREKFLNQFPQYKTSIQGLDIHYLHVKPQKTAGVKVVPLLMIHGWPGSIREFYEIIPLLTTPQKNRDYVFEVIVPSLPGYGFSDAAVRPGLGAAQVAVLFKNFMQRLGYEKYYIQGGDWGSIIVHNMAIMFPEKILAVHANICFVNTPLSNLKTFLYSFYPSAIVSKKYEDKVYPMSSRFSFIILETGYMHLQSTKPDTAGVSLRESPVGLAAYILEKFTTWTNPAWKDRVDGGLTEKYSMTNLLDNVMIYWVTDSITTSMRLYSETFNKAHMSLRLDAIPVEVPTGCSRFSNEIVYQPDAILKEKYSNLVQVTDLEGGHFAAFEAPEVLAEDIFNFIDKVV